METETTTEATNEVFELNLCDMGSTIPVSHLSLEEGIEVPLKGWSGLFEEMGIKILTDPAGRPAITTLAARQLLNTLRRRDKLAVEHAQRRTEKLAKKHPISVGREIPAQEGLSPFETMVAAGGVVSPQDEFGSGRERPNFLREELAAGQRADAEKKRLAAERKKERLIDQAKDKLR